MNIKEITAKSIIRRHKKIDSWFISRQGMNLYRGCSHNCVYCDGRAEGYYVEGEFGCDISVKKNALEILDRELDPKRKRKPGKQGFILLGGGVGDSYQPTEEKYQLTQGVLQLILKYKLPVHILTKSTLVMRDIDLITRINQQNQAVVSFSFSSMDPGISKIFEPGVPSPDERIKTLKAIKEKGIATGVFLLPVIPYVSDSPAVIETSFKKVKEADVDFIIFGGMTLKTGRQMDYFKTCLKKYFPNIIHKYLNLYKDNKWGQASGKYYSSLNNIFNRIAQDQRLPVRMPLHLFQGLLENKDLVIVLLEHMDFILKLNNKKSPYGYAAYSLSQIKGSLEEHKDKLKSLKGIGSITESIILEILKNGTSDYYKKLTSL